MFHPLNDWWLNTFTVFSLINLLIIVIHWPPGSLWKSTCITSDAQFYLFSYLILWMFPLLFSWETSTSQLISSRLLACSLFSIPSLCLSRTALPPTKEGMPWTWFSVNAPYLQTFLISHYTFLITTYYPLPSPYLSHLKPCTIASLQLKQTSTLPPLHPLLPVPSLSHWHSPLLTLLLYGSRLSTLFQNQKDLLPCNLSTKQLQGITVRAIQGSGGNSNLKLTCLPTMLSCQKFLCQDFLQRKTGKLCTQSLHAPQHLFIITHQLPLLHPL